MEDKKEQFGKIYDEYIGKIYRFVYLKVNSQEVAEDITSQVFLKGWEFFQKKENGFKNPGAFLYKTARNLVIDYYREKGRIELVSPENSPELRGKDDLYQKAVFNADLAAVKSALTKIKPAYQDIIIWHYLEDFSIEEIAKMTGKLPVTIRVMLHRGLKELKKKIEEV